MNLKDEYEQNSNNELEMIDGSIKNEDIGNHHAFTQLPLIENEIKKPS